MPDVRRALPWLLIAVVGLGACSDGDDDERIAVSNLTGSWFGIVDDDLKEAGVIEVDFTQTGATVGGTWRTTYDDPSNDDQGTLSGTVDGNRFTATFTPDDPETECSFVVDADRRGEDRIAGIYDTIPGECLDQDVGGVIDIERD